MYVLVDNTEQGEVVFFVLEKQEAMPYKFDASMNLPSILEKVLEDQKKVLSDLKGIAVRVGKGRFTATRVAVTFANTLSYALRIPVISVTTEKPAEVLPLLEGAKADKYITARYSGEPRLGGKNT